MVAGLAIYGVSTLFSSGQSHRNTATTGTAAPASTSAVPLTVDQIPDVLMPGLWHGHLSATRDGNSVTIKTGWKYYSDDEVTICVNALSDLGYGFASHDLIVQVMGGVNNDVLGVWNMGSGKCHDVGNHS